MIDLLVNLLKLPPVGPSVEKLAKGVLVRRANCFEMTPIREFVEKNFSMGWADENSPRGQFLQRPGERRELQQVDEQVGHV